MVPSGPVWGHNAFRRIGRAAHVCRYGLFAACLAMTSAASAQDLTMMRLATGPTGGTLFPVGGAIANVVSNPPGSQPCERGGKCGVPGLIATAMSTGGSVENIDLLLSGQAQAALVHADVAFAAVTGKLEGTDATSAKGLRALAALYPEAVHLVLRNGVEIDGIRALDGVTLSAGGIGSGARYAAGLALKALGLRPGDRALDPGPAAEAMLNGDLDAFITVSGLPSPIVSELTEAGAATLLPVSGFDAAQIIADHGFFQPLMIPADTYPGTPELETLGLQTLLVVNADMEDRMAEELTRALWHPNSQATYVTALPDGVGLDPANARMGVALKLHKGAAAFYATMDADQLEPEAEVEAGAEDTLSSGS